MVTITRKDVEDIALLARLRLTDEESARMMRDLGAILEYVDQLRDVDTQGVEPMTHAVPVDCPLRADTVSPSLSAEEALGGAPCRQDDFFAVPRIIDVHAAEAERKP